MAKSKYSNLKEYSIKLSEATGVFDNTMFLYSKPPRQWGSFVSSLTSLKQKLTDMIMAQNVLDQMRMIPKLDKVAIEDNKNSKKISDEVVSIRTDLMNRMDKLKKDYIKQLSVCSKQYLAVEKKITDERDKERFNDNRTINFKNMMQDVETDIPFGELKEMNQQMVAESEKKHIIDSQKINKSYESINDISPELENALVAINKLLESTSNDKIAADIKKEVEEIREVLPARTVTVSEDILKKLRHSEQLKLDLEQLNEVMRSRTSFLGRDGKLRRINRKIEKLKSPISRALKEENKKIEENKEEYNDIQDKVDEASNAIETYQQILNQNKKNSTDPNGKKITELPRRYTEMKERLEKISTLNGITKSQLYNVSNGGRSK